MALDATEDRAEKVSKPPSRKEVTAKKLTKSSRQRASHRGERCVSREDNQNVLNHPNSSSSRPPTRKFTSGDDHKKTSHRKKKTKGSSMERRGHDSSDDKRRRDRTESSPNKDREPSHSDNRKTAHSPSSSSNKDKVTPCFSKHDNKNDPINPPNISSSRPPARKSTRHGDYHKKTSHCKMRSRGEESRESKERRRHDSSDDKKRRDRREPISEKNRSKYAVDPKGIVATRSSKIATATESIEQRKTRIQSMLAESKTTGTKPSFDVLMEAVELGVLDVPAPHQARKKSHSVPNATRPTQLGPTPSLRLREMTTDDAKKALAALKINPPARVKTSKNSSHRPSDKGTTDAKESSRTSHHLESKSTSKPKDKTSGALPSDPLVEASAQSKPLVCSRDSVGRALPDPQQERCLEMPTPPRKAMGASSFNLGICFLCILLVAVVVLLPLAFFTDIFINPEPSGSPRPPVAAPASEPSGSGSQSPPLESNPASPIAWPSPSPATTAEPAPPPTENLPTSGPTSIFQAPLFGYLIGLGITPDEILQNPKTPQGQAFRWLLMGSNHNEIDVFRLPERYALVALDFSLRSDEYGSWKREDRDICDWQGVTCDVYRRHVKEIKWSNQGLRGYIIPELGLLSQLETVDLAQNAITGNLEVFWDLPSLAHLYLFENRFTGSIPSRPAPPNLKRFYLGSNQLTGSLPLTLASSTYGPRALRYLSLYNNQLGGTLPEGMRLRDLFYLDLSNNQFSGPLPSDFVRNLVRLRILYLGNNNFSGRLSANFASLGDGRMKQVFINDNSFSGKFPSGWSATQMSNIDISNNLFYAADKEMCNLSVFEDGEMVEYRTDCEICECHILCQTCT